MAIYKFRISLEQEEDVYRDVEIKSNQSFAKFLGAILDSVKFKHGADFSFYQSDSAWHKEDWIAGTENLKGPIKISKFIFDPHQRFILEYDHENPWEFYIELLKVSIKEDENVEYPRMVKTVGIAPPQYKIVPKFEEDDELDLDMLSESDDGEDMGDDDFKLDFLDKLDADDLSRGDEG